MIDENKALYFYKARIDHVVDGDTVHATIDLGMGISRTETLRLAGINAPEMRGEDRYLGQQSKDWLISKVEGMDVIVETIKDRSGKYGRLLAVIHFNNRDINEEMVLNGMAVRYM